MSDPAGTRDPRLRFSDRVGDYRATRPGYPPRLLDELREQGALFPDAAVADVGSGTGILTRLLLEAGHPVFAVEPNDAMRRAAEEDLENFRGFHSVAGSAEATTLPGGSVDLVTAAQAFHWFDRAAARSEFGRILRPGGQVALVWNERLTGTPFLDAYEALLLRVSIDYTVVDHRRVDAPSLEAFFGPAGYRASTFPNEQRFDLAGLKSRLGSSSYVPPEGHPGHAGMMEALEAIFAEHQSEGRVVFRYETKLYTGRLG
jgi:SAM-dependent methyltransferase